MKKNTKLQKGFAPIFIVLIIVLGIGGISGTYGAIEYHKTSKLVKEAKQLTKEEKYNEATGKLELAQNSWLTKNLGVKKQEINEKINKNKNLLEDKLEYTQGIEEFDKGNWEEARKLLSKVSEDFPHYQETKNKIEEAQKKITKEQIAETTAEAEKEVIKATCQNECSSSGLKRCYDNGYQVCGNYDADKCLEWGSTSICPVNNICQNGNCVQQKCSDRTLYGQCSTDRSKYCENGKLIDKCSLCGCFTDYFCDITFECKKAGALIRPIKIGVIEFAPKDVQYGKLYHCKGGSIFPLQQTPVPIPVIFQLTQQDCPEGIEEYNFLEIFNNPAGVLYFEDVRAEYLSHSVYYIDEWLNNEALKYNKTIKINLEVKGPYTLTESPPSSSRKNLCPGTPSFFNKKAEENGINLENYDVVIYIYFDDHLLSQRQYQGFVSCAFPPTKTTFNNVETWTILGDHYLSLILHELVHVLGAGDTYLEPCPRGNYWTCCKIPEGIPEPNKVPLYPQTKACLMCGQIQLKEDGEGLVPGNLSFVTLCETTAKEIGLIK